MYAIRSYYALHSQLKQKFIEGDRITSYNVCYTKLLRPCATENEVGLDDAKELANNGCKLLAEASNMGCTAEAVDFLSEAMDYAPGKAVNAGGVAVSGLEMSQNSMRINWPREEA